MKKITKIILLAVAVGYLSCSTTRKTKTATAIKQTVTRDSIATTKAGSSSDSTAVTRSLATETNTIKITFRPDSAGQADPVVIPMDTYGDEPPFWYRKYADVAPVDSASRKNRGLQLPAGKIASIEITTTRARVTSDSVVTKRRDTASREAAVSETTTTEIKVKDKSVQRIRATWWIWILLMLSVAWIIWRRWRNLNRAITATPQQPGRLRLGENGGIKDWGPGVPPKTQGPPPPPG